MAFLLSKTVANNYENDGDYVLLFLLYNRIYAEARKERYNQDIQAGIFSKTFLTKNLRVT